MSKAATWGGVGFQVCVVPALRGHVGGAAVRVAEQLHPVRPVCQPVLLPRLLPQLPRGGPHPAVQAVRQVPRRSRASRGLSSRSGAEGAENKLFLRAGSSASALQTLSHKKPVEVSRFVVSVPDKRCLTWGFLSVYESLEIRWGKIIGCIYAFF